MKTYKTWKWFAPSGKATNSPVRIMDNDNENPFVELFYGGSSAFSTTSLNGPWITSSINNGGSTISIPLEMETKENTDGQKEEKPALPRPCGVIKRSLEF